MLKLKDLNSILQRIDGKGYKAYKDIQGSYDCGNCILFIDHVQSDPFAPPSRIRIRVPMRQADFPPYLYEGVRLTALEDIIARIIKKELSSLESRIFGTGKSGLIYIDAGGQEVIKRTAVKITPEFAEARLSAGLPASGRTIKGQAASIMLSEILPEIAAKCLYFKSLDEEYLKSHVYLFEDQELIRNKLKELGLIAFVGDGSILPRKSGNSNLPLSAKQAVKFKSPESMKIVIDTLHHGLIEGMGIKKGITLIVGGGYHGKTTLLKAIERGIYNHIAGDGREWVVSLSDAVKIRAEDGRNIEKVDIRPFIDNLPFGKDTKAFSTENASGSTSQAANIMEAIEAGAKVLLLDEDTSATNFMIRDARMQQLVMKEKEPITPFIDRVRSLYDNYGISTVVVIGGAGDYLDVADKVIMLDSYQVFDVSDKAAKIADRIASNRNREVSSEFRFDSRRIIKKQSFPFSKEKRIKIAAKSLYNIMYGKQFIELFAVEQLVDSGQTRAIADLLRYMQKYVDDNRSLTEVLDLVYNDLHKDFEVISSFPAGNHPGDLVYPRKYELASAINRMRTLKME